MVGFETVRYLEHQKSFLYHTCLFSRIRYCTEHKRLLIIRFFLLHMFFSEYGYAMYLSFQPTKPMGFIFTHSFNKNKYSVEVLNKGKKTFERVLILKSMKMTTKPLAVITQQKPSKQRGKPVLSAHHLQIIILMPIRETCKRHAMYVIK